MKRFSVSMLLKCLALSVLLGGMASNSLAAPKGSPWGPEYFPNITLVDQDGQKLKFYEDLLKDKIVIINFIFTHCGDSCPSETANLRKVQKLLGSRMGKDIFFYSISIDPDHDSPEVLKAYAAKFKITPDSGWKFLTATKEETIQLRRTFGLFREGYEEKNLSEHSTSIMMGNEHTGQWFKRSPYDEPKVLAWLIGRTLSTFKAYQEGKTADTVNYADAGKIRKIPKGEELFHSRCDGCHSLGAEDNIGPGLLNVTKVRDPAWLRKWLKTPEVMLAEKDPLVISLFKKYNEVIMPSFKFSDKDVEEIIKYMEETSVALEEPAADSAEHAGHDHAGHEHAHHDHHHADEQSAESTPAAPAQEVVPAAPVKAVDNGLL